MTGSDIEFASIPINERIPVTFSVRFLCIDLLVSGPFPPWLVDNLESLVRRPAIDHSQAFSYRS